MYKNKKTLSLLLILGLIGIIPSALAYYRNYLELNQQTKNSLILSEIKSDLNSSFSKGKSWPTEYKNRGQDLEIDYTFNQDLTKYIKKLIRRHRSDYSAVIVLDNDTGEILSAVGFNKKKNSFAKYLAFSGSHPSASLIKIITSAELLRTGKVKKDMVYSYYGKGTTLYKYQLKNRKSKWNRYQSFSKAFAFSNNVIFGKLAMNTTTGVGMFKTASDFGFNKSLMDDLDLSISVFQMPNSQYNLAELATGFNKETQMSPVHGALLSSIVANNGILKRPKVISSVFDSKSGKEFFKSNVKAKRVLERVVTDELKELMKGTVKKGTARGSFRNISRILKQNLDFGGKTGSISGGIPFGKRDWFTAFAMPKDVSLGKGISICVMNINVKKWYVRSSYLAKKIMEHYYKKIKPFKNLATKSKTSKLKSGV